MSNTKFDFTELEELQASAPSIFAIPGMLLTIALCALLQLWRSFVPATDTIYHIADGTSKHAKGFSQEADLELIKRTGKLNDEAAKLGMSFNDGKLTRLDVIESSPEDQAQDSTSG